LTPYQDLGTLPGLVSWRRTKARGVRRRASKKEEAVVKRIWYSLFAVLFVAMVACTPQQQAADAALKQAQNANIYVNHNQVELANYNKRQEIADNPATILWCTSSFPQSNSPMFTTPIVGKLTSSTKRPYSTEPDASGMYGGSTEYRYGFTPSGFYADFYNIATFCTTELTLFQRQQTVVMLAPDDAVNVAQKQAQAALAAGDPKKATQILLDVLKK
jgi:hypothetical protein